VSQSLKTAVMRAVLRLLDPLARLLLDAGIGIGEFHQLAKRAYVRAALEVARKERPNFSQIGVLTGIPRREIASLLDNSSAGPPEVERGTQQRPLCQPKAASQHTCMADREPLRSLIIARYLLSFSLVICRAGKGTPRMPLARTDGAHYY
jgi:hypothetical protein